jgi:hypothetical protein
MRLATLISLALLSMTAQAQVTTFNKECLENEANVVALQAPRATTQPVLEGEVCDRGQLTAEDLSYVESVQPRNAVRKTNGRQ